MPSAADGAELCKPAKKGGRGIWQREYLIRSEADYVQHVAFISIQSNMVM